MMTIFVDADACPVKNLIVGEAKKRELSVVMVADTSHQLADGYSTCITVDKGADSADLRIANLLQKGDIVITQDYGVAALALGKGAKAISQNGLIYSEENIQTLLFERHLSAKARRAGKRGSKIKKRTEEENRAFLHAFCALLEKN